MRIGRALDKLSALLAKRGIRSSVAALGIGLSSQALVAAPVGMASTIAAGAIAQAIALSANATLGTAFALMKSSKFALTSCSIVTATLVGSALYLSTQASQARQKLETLQAEPISAYDLDDLRGQILKKTRELSQLGSIPPRPTAPTPAHGFTTEDFESALADWVERVDDLAEFLTANPHLRIPDLSILSTREWMDVLKNAELETEADYRKAAASLRAAAGHKTFPKLVDAYKAYKEASNGKPLQDASELKPFLDSSFGSNILEYWRVNPSEEESSKLRLAPNTILYNLPVDSLWDTRFSYYDRFSGFSSARNGYAIANGIDRFRIEFQRDPEFFGELKPYVPNWDIPEADFDEVRRAMHTPIQFETIEESNSK